MNRTILVTHDSETVREVLTLTLEEEGYIVLFANNGKEAFRFFNGQPIDMVITSPHLDEMDGVSLTKAIRSTDLYHRTPILFMMPNSQQDTWKEFKAAGASGWITEPFIPAKLVSVIKRYLS